MVPGQRSLFASGEPAIDVDACWERMELGEGSCVDVARGYLRGADAVLDHVVATVPWRAGRRHMYDRMVDDPRLSYRCEPGGPPPHPQLARVKADLVHRYGVRLGELALNFYRDGRDSVAFHRDRELRELDDTLVVILTLGARRPFRIRPFGTTGARSLDLAPDSGDLLVMGGTFQREWEHGVPKVASVGPRVSAMWRWSKPAEVVVDETASVTGRAATLS